MVTQTGSEFETRNEELFGYATNDVDSAISCIDKRDYVQACVHLADAATAYEIAGEVELAACIRKARELTMSGMGILAMVELNKIER